MANATTATDAQNVDASLFARTWLGAYQHLVKTQRDSQRPWGTFKFRVRTQCQRTLQRARVQPKPFEHDPLCDACVRAANRRRNPRSRP